MPDEFNSGKPILMIYKTVFFTALAIAVLGQRPADAAVITISLSNATLSPTAAAFDVSASFAGDTPLDFVDSIQLSVIDSSSSLTAAATDFSRFSFNTTLADWGDINGGVFDPSGFVWLLTPPPPPAAGGFSPIGDGDNVTLGTLSVNTVGLAPGTYDVSFNDFASFFPTEAFGEVNGIYDSVPLVLNPASRSFTISAVPEPSTWGVLLCSMAAFAVCRRRRRMTPVPGSHERG